MLLEYIWKDLRLLILIAGRLKEAVTAVLLNSLYSLLHQSPISYVPAVSVAKLGVTAEVSTSVVLLALSKSQKAKTRSSTSSCPLHLTTHSDTFAGNTHQPKTVASLTRRNTRPKGISAASVRLCCGSGIRHGQN